MEASISQSLYLRLQLLAVTVILSSFLCIEVGLLTFTGIMTFINLIFILQNCRNK